MQAQAPKVISHLPRSQLVWGQAQERREQRPEIMTGEFFRREKAKDDQSAQQGLHLNPVAARNSLGFSFSSA